MLAGAFHVVWGRIESGAGTENSVSDTTSKSASGSPAARAGNLLDRVVFVQERSDSWRGSRSNSNMSPLANLPPEPCLDAAQVEETKAASSSDGKKPLAAQDESEDSDCEDCDAEGEAKPRAAIKAILDTLTDRDNGLIMEMLLIPGCPESQALQEFWSDGCQLHRVGQCKQCQYAHMDGGCRKGSECEFCHIPHMKRSKVRLCKRKRERRRRWVRSVDRIAQAQPARFHTLVAMLVEENTKLRALLQSGTIKLDTLTARGGKLVLSL